MTLTIGRFSIDECPYDITHDGDRLSFSLDIDGSSTGGDHDVAKVYRQQLLGLVDNDDEPVVPVTWEDDPDWDGFYRVGRVEMVPTPVYLLDSSSVRHFSVRVDLERVGAFANPMHELYVLAVDASSANIGALNEGGFGSTSTLGLAYLPDSMTMVSERGTAAGRTALDGSGFRYFGGTVADDGSSTRGVSHLCDPVDFYDAACVIEEFVGGSWYVVVGRQVRNGAVLRISNGVVRVSIATDGEITVEHWDGSGWVSKSYTATYDTGSGTISDFNSVRIWRNSPDTVSVRWVGVTSADEACNLDVTIGRGQNVAEFSVATFSAQTWKVTRSTTEAAIAINDHSSNPVAIQASANDANGDRFVLAGRQQITADTTNGGITFATTTVPNTPGGFVAAAQVSFGIGLAVGGSSATGVNTPSALAANYQVAVFVERSVSS